MSLEGIYNSLDSTNCIGRMLQGVEIGYRHTCMMIVGSYMYKHGMDSGVVLAILESMNMRNQARLDISELSTIVRDSRTYKFSCSYIKENTDYCVGNCGLLTSVEPGIFKTVDDIFSSALDTIENSRNVPFGIYELDSVTMGFWPGTVSYILGASNVGKSKWAFHLMGNQARLGKKPLMVEFEMTSSEIAQTLIEETDGVDILKATELIMSEYNEVLDRVKARYPNTLYISDISMTTDKFKASLIHAINEYNIDIAYLDMLQFLNVPGTDRFDKAARRADAVREIAKECNIPLVILHHPVKNLSKYSVPDSRDARDAGEIPQWAYIMLGCYRKKGNPEKLVVKILKNKGKDITAGGKVEYPIDPNHIVFNDEITE